MSHFLSAGQLERADVERLLASAKLLESKGAPRRRDTFVALAFFEDSLRTRIGFQVAATRLGADTVALDAPKRTPRMSSAESFADTIRSVAGWCDAICIRHPDANAVTEVAELVESPLINCGNGTEEHPTQALVDLFAISRLRGEIDGVRLGLVGDLEGMRAVHSLALAVSRFDDIFVRCIAPAGLGLPEGFTKPLLDAGHEVEQTETMAIDDLDVVYMAGLPASTAIGRLDPARRAAFRLDREAAAGMRPGAHVLCPLPRVDEIDADLDGTPRAAYFAQSDMALPMRMAILDEMLQA